MFKTITEELSKDEVINILRGMDAHELGDKFSVRLVLIEKQACMVFGGDSEESFPLAPGTYMAVYYDYLVTEYPFFDRICESITLDENKCQTLMNGNGIILIFMLNKYE